MSLKNVDAALASLKRTKKVVTGVRQSNVEAAYLREAQESIGAPQRALIQENHTRYVSVACVVGSLVGCSLAWLLEWVID